MAVAPGTEAVRDLFLLKRGEPQRCWCLCHWVATFGKGTGESRNVERDEA